MRVAMILLAACAATSAQTAESTDFRPQLCAAGISPGDPSCPPNQVSLATGAGSAETIFGELDFSVATDGRTLTTSSITIRAFAHGLHAAQLGFVSAAATSTVIACPATLPADAPTIDLQPDTTTMLPAQMVADERYACIVYTALGAYR